MEAAAAQPMRKVSVLLGAGILFVPYIFSWFLLRKGHTTVARVIGFGWFAVALLMVSGDRKPKTEPAVVPTQNAAATAAPSPQAQTLAPSNKASEQEFDFAKERATNQATLDVVRRNLKNNREHMKKFYATERLVKDTSSDRTKLLAIELARGPSKYREDQKQAAEAKALGAQVSQQLREMYASMLEENFMKNGIDAKVRASGKDMERLSVTYALMSQPLVYKFQNDMQLPSQARAVGFKKVVYSNGFESDFGKTWTVDL